MKEIKVGLQKELAPGTLMWIYANNNKVYHSSKRFDTAAFKEHDSNYLGEVEDVYSNKDKQHSLIFRMLKESDRIYGVCLNDENGQVSKSKKTEEAPVLFFPTWDKLVSFAETYFEKSDQQEMKRKEEAKQAWIKRGKLYKKKAKQNEVKD